MYCVNNNNSRVLHPVKDMGSEMFELCDTPHYFVFRRVGLNSTLELGRRRDPKEEEHSKQPLKPPFLKQ